MFCKQCGTSLLEGAKNCPNCGMAVEQSSQSSQPTSKETSGNNQRATNRVFAQSAQMPTVNKEFILRNVNAILAGISVVLMFLPMFVINCSALGYSGKLSESGFAVASGVKFSDYSATSVNFFAWLMILIPIFSILVNYIKPLYSIKKITLFAAPLVCIISLFFARSIFVSSMNAFVSSTLGLVNVSISPAYLVDSLAWLLVGYLQYMNMPLTKDSVVNLIN
ncbi:zinc-ribbon domain-containing protein [Caproicibacterium sp. NSD3]